MGHGEYEGCGRQTGDISSFAFDYGSKMSPEDICIRGVTGDCVSPGHVLQSNAGSSAKRVRMTFLYRRLCAKLPVLLSERMTPFPDLSLGFRLVMVSPRFVYLQDLLHIVTLRKESPLARSRQGRDLSITPSDSLLASSRCR